MVTVFEKSDNTENTDCDNSGPYDNSYYIYSSNFIYKSCSEARF